MGVPETYLLYLILKFRYMVCFNLMELEWFFLVNQTERLANYKTIFIYLSLFISMDMLKDKRLRNSNEI